MARFSASAPPVCLLLGALLLADVAAGQTPRTRDVEIIHADSLVGTTVGGEAVRTLFGNVHIRQENTELWSDRATQYVDRDDIFFYGNVRIIEEGDSLSADSVHYNRRLKTGRATGQVRLSDGEVEVFAPSGLYFVDEKRAQFEDGVRLVDSLTVLTSRGGEYWTDEKLAEFFGDVILNEERTRLSADSVTYHRETEVAYARGAVFIEQFDEDGGGGVDSLQTTWLYGNRATNDHRARFSRIEGDALLVRLEADSLGALPDTLVMRALVLEASRQDTLERLVAVDSVRIWRRDIAALADSVVYDRFRLEGDSTRDDVRFFGYPTTWFRTSQISGDTIRTTMQNGSVDSLFVRERAFVAQLDTLLDRVRQLRGRNLLGLFSQDTLRTLTVGPNAEAIYYLSDSDDHPNGAVRISGDRIVFRFNGDELERASVIEGTEGIYYPEGHIPEAFFLDDYRWTPETRPNRRDLVVPHLDPDPPPALALPPSEPDVLTDEAVGRGG
jgi:lipopolysaccharide export system protein LptA